MTSNVTVQFNANNDEQRLVNTISNIESVNCDIGK